MKNTASVLLCYLSLILLYLPISNCFQTSIPLRHFPTRRTQDQLTELQETKNKKPKGVYTRPSAAIERGSGFYVPGLEGSRVRGLFGLLILGLTLLNANYNSSEGILPNGVDGSAQATSQLISILYGFLLILQGLVEFGKESGFVVDLSNTNSDTDETTNDTNKRSEDTQTVNQYASDTVKSFPSDLVENLQWLAASFVSLTPATHVLLLRSSTSTSSTPEVLYTLGEFPTSFLNFDKTAITKSIEAVMSSRGGRISIPSDHPGSSLLPEFYRRCILLQKLDFDSEGEYQYSLMVGSNQLLAAFTKNDLKWLGRLANYFELALPE